MPVLPATPRRDDAAADVATLVKLDLIEPPPVPSPDPPPPITVPLMAPLDPPENP